MPGLGKPQGHGTAWGGGSTPRDAPGSTPSLQLRGTAPGPAASTAAVPTLLGLGAAAGDGNIGVLGRHHLA